MTGSKRIVDHTTFAELHWKRDDFSPNFILAQGFQKIYGLLNKDIIEILQDIHALQCKRDFPDFTCLDSIALLHVDNHQASVQSRLVDLPRSSAFLNCIYTAAYLSACALCNKVWRSSIIPVSVIYPSKIQVIYGCGSFASHTNLSKSQALMEYADKEYARDMCQLNC
jgi:hypothetical protein